MMFGGREAEVMKFGAQKVTNGATGDIQSATGLARAMVMEWGMSDKLGRVRYQSNQQEVFLGHSVAQRTNMSEETAKQIDEEIRSLIDDGEREARRILTEKRADWERLAEALLEYETLTGDEITRVLKGEKLERPDDTPSTPSAPVPALPVTDEDEQPAPTGWGGAAPQGA